MIPITLAVMIEGTALICGFFSPIENLSSVFRAINIKLTPYVRRLLS
jgi:hypothetical protein